MATDMGGRQYLPPKINEAGELVEPGKVMVQTWDGEKLVETEEGK